MKALGIKIDSISVTQFVLLLALANILVYNFQLFTFSFANLDYASLNGASTLLTIFTVVFSFSAIIFFLFALVSPHALKGFCVVVAVSNSIAIYFINTYQVVFDRSMMGNVLNTRMEESAELLHPMLLFYILILGVLPAWLITKVRVQRQNRLRTLSHLVVTAVVGLLIVYANASTTLWIDKHASRLGGVILPWSFAVSTLRVSVAQSTADDELTPLPSLASHQNEKAVVILVIGETARAGNFSLYGYERNTNPLLAGNEVISLRNTTSCSTYTTASIHCMLSHDGSGSGPYEALPTYLQRNNIDVIWRSNNWGEPKITVKNYEKKAELKESCSGANCNYDEVLLSGLAERIAASQKEQVFVVLHTKGSHGPSYFSRYPAAFEEFKPVCRSVELDKCTQDELINAYDNTILYTDYFLDQTITQLKTLTDTPVLMIYVSDHGESLGEYGLYLHGTPYSVAPDVQKVIPFILWMSDSFKKQHGIQDTSFTLDRYSHDNVFHSVLGAFGMRGEIYNEGLDIFSR